MEKSNYKKIDENDLSVRVAKKEGGEENLSIAQIKEVQKILLDELASEFQDDNIEGIIELIEKHIKKD